MTQDSLIVQKQKPLWRGWIHAVAFPVASVAGVALIATAPTTAGRVSSAIFVATAALLFGVSALLHRGRWTPRVENGLRRLDHANIYLIIAGTYTPFAVLSMPPDQGRTMLIVVWVGSIAGMLFRVFWTGAPRWLSTSLYVAVGSVVLFFVPEFLEGAGVVPFVLVAVGGLLYTAGAVVYGTKRPTLVPGVFGFHELFHALTVAAFTCHYIAIWMVVHQA